MIGTRLQHLRHSRPAYAFAYWLTPCSFWAPNAVPPLLLCCTHERKYLYACLWLQTAAHTAKLEQQNRELAAQAQEVGGLCNGLGA